MKKIALAFLITGQLLLANNALADWHKDTILRLVTFVDGGVQIVVRNQHECGSQVISYNTSAPGARIIYAALLAYEAQQKPINFAIQSCSGTNAIIDRVRGEN